MRTALSLACGLWPLAAALAAPAAAGQGTSAAPAVELRLSGLEDPGDALRVEDLRQAAARGDFTPFDSTVVNHGFTTATWWYRLQLRRSAAPMPTTQWVVEIAYPPLDEVDIHLNRAGALEPPILTGDQRPRSPRLLDYRTYAVPLQLAAGETLTLDLRVRTSGSHQLPIRLWTADEFFAHAGRANRGYGLFFGALAIMALYNLCIWLVVRDRIYLYFIATVCSLGGLQATLGGFAQQALISETVARGALLNLAVPLLVVASIVFNVVFVRVFLRVRSYAPGLDRALFGVIALGGGVGLLSLLLPYSMVVPLIALPGALAAVLLIAAAILGLRRGIRTARFYLIGWGVLFVGVLIKVSELYGLVPASFFTVHSWEIGLTLSVMLLSLALADRITADREARESLERERAVLDAAASAKNEFLAKASHELRTPMNAIIGFTDLALRSDSQERRAEHLRHIDTASRSLLHVINDILDISRIEAGQLQLQSRPFRVQPLFDQVAELFAPQAAEKGLELIVHPAPDPGFALLGDARRIEQVLINLVGNAIKFTETGEVELDARILAQSDTAVQLQFAIRDSGIGMSPQAMRKLFVPFSQVDDSTTRRFGGTGLGLAICRQLVELMGGEMTVDSTPGRGSRFAFRLECALTDEARAAGTALPDRALRVLVADDNAAARSVYAEILDSLSITADTVESGEDALARLQAEPYDALLIDWKMPGLDGIETTRRALAQRPELPVLVMTAHGREDLFEAALAAGAKAFLEKPVRPSLLLETLQEAVESRARTPRLSRASLAGLPSAAAVRGMHILLVEDNPMNRRLANEILVDAGATIEHAENGQLGIERVQGGRFDLVLMDIQMPVLDGLSATREIRKKFSADTLPVVALTANAMPVDRAACKAAGMNDFLAKPIDAQKLLDCVGGFRPQRLGEPEPVDAAPSPEVATDAPFPEALPGIDLAGALARLGGRTALLASMLREFVEEQADATESIEAALAGGDLDQARRRAHSLKGLAGNLGCETLAGRAADLERAAAAGTVDGDALLPPLRAAFAELRAAVESLPAAPAVQPSDAPEVPPDFDAETVLTALRAQLVAGNFDAADLYHDAEAGLRARYGAEKLEALAKALHDFDFDRALDAITTLRGLARS